MNTARTFTRVLEGNIRPSGLNHRDYHFVWDEKGNLGTSVELMLDGSLSENVTFEYDGQGRLIKRTVYSPQTVYPAVQIYSYEKHKHTEYEKRYVRLSLFETKKELFFNEYGKVNCRKKFINGEIARRTDIIYNEKQLITEKQYWNYSRKHGTQKRRSTCEYDESGNLTEYISYDTDGQTISGFEKYHYNEVGLLIQKEIGLNKTSCSYEYDETGRMQRKVEESILGSLITQYDYKADGSCTIKKEKTVNDGDTSYESLSYNEKGFLISKIQQSKEDDSPYELHYHFDFDKDGNWIKRYYTEVFKDKSKLELLTELDLTFYK